MSAKLVQRGNAAKRVDYTLSRFSNAYAKVGILRGSEPDADGRLTLGELATIHEFGAPEANIPERSFMRLGLKSASGELKRVTARLVPEVARGKMTEAAALRKIADIAHKSIRGTFKERGPNWPALAPRTVQRKGHDAPLIDTNTLYEAIEMDVVTPGKKR